MSDGNNKKRDDDISNNVTRNLSMIIHHDEIRKISEVIIAVLKEKDKSVEIKEGA